MIIEAFLRWTQTASANDRAKAAGSLTRGFLAGFMDAADSHAAEAALSFLLDDPSPKVRLAIAEEMAGSVDAPRAIVHALARDQIEVAGHVIAFSPVLSDGDLIDIVADCLPEIQRVVAMRPTVSAGVCAAIAEVGEVEAVCDMLENDGAEIASVSLRRIVERFGDEVEVRARLLNRPGLPCDVRQRLVVSVGEALAISDLIRRAVGDGRVKRITEDACRAATLDIAANLPLAELPALVEHLRVSGQLSAALLIHSLCQGNVDFYAAALVSLSGQPLERVRGIVVDGKTAALRALTTAAGLPRACVPVFVSATLMWREDTQRSHKPFMGSTAERLVAAFAGAAEEDSDVADLLMLVEKLNFSHRRRLAREEALALAGVRAA